MPPRIIKSKIRRYFSRQRGALAVYLFGSQARGQAGPTSDVDVGVLLGRRSCKNNFLKKLKYSSDLSRLLGAEFDVTILNEADPLLCVQALWTGPAVWVKDPDRVARFEQEALRRYWDFIPTLRIMNEAAVDRLKAYRG